MTETLLSYLTTRNPNILAYAKPAPTFTFNNEWDTVEGIKEWADFEYDTLRLRFGTDLNRHVPSFDATKRCEEGGHHKIFDESGLSHLICTSIILPVSAVLHPSFIAAGGRVTKHVGCVPDWGAGKDVPAATESNGRVKALVLGDTKFNWSSTHAISVVQNMTDGSYEDARLRDTVRPIEQVQHYGAIHRCRYGYIISDQELMVLRLHLAPDPVRTSPRPQRTRALPSHQRITSSSTISRQLTDMSIDESSFKARIGRVEYKKIPWGATGGRLTIKFALYCITRLAAEDGNDLKTEYPPLASTVAPPVTQRVRSTVLPPSSQPRNTVPTASTVTSTTQTSKQPEVDLYYDTTVTRNAAGGGYDYKDNDKKWVFNDDKANWTVFGEKICKLKGSPPYPRSDIPRV
jgi:hypothetical protein